MSVGTRLPLELLAEYVSLTKACCCLCKLTSRQSGSAKEACGPCVVYNLPLGAATPGNLVLRSATLFTLSKQATSKDGFHTCKKTGTHRHGRKSSPDSGDILNAQPSATGFASANNSRESPTKYLNGGVRALPVTPGQYNLVAQRLFIAFDRV